MKEISYGYCQCGCRNKTTISGKTRTKIGHIKGEPVTFRRGHKCKHGRLRGRYKQIYIDGVPTAEHRVIAAKALGKPLPPEAEIHHVNGTGTDNENRNLVICQDVQYHRLLHLRLRSLLASGFTNYRKCQYCKTYDHPNNLFTRQSGQYHPSCLNKYKKNLLLRVLKRR